MNIDKEREAFEDCYKTSRDYKFYVKHEMSEKQIFEFKNDKYVVDCVNDGWKIWQAAKSQAVPEGFVLVPMVPSERMINAVRQCYEGEAYLPYSLYSEFVNQAIIERMEAQEPTND